MSNIIGKWVKFIAKTDTYGDFFTTGKWYKCISDPSNMCAFIDNSGEENGILGLNYLLFDLNNPQEFPPFEANLEYESALINSLRDENVKLRDAINDVLDVLVEEKGTPNIVWITTRLLEARQ